MSKITKKYLYLLCICVLLISVFAFKTKSAYAENLDSIYVNLNIDGITYNYSYPDITYKSGIEEILIKQGKYDRKGRLKEITGKFNAEYEFKNLREYLEEIAKRTDVAPVEATVSFDPSNVNFKTTPEVFGKKLNVDKIIQDVNLNLKKGKSYSAVIKSDIVKPQVTQKSLKRSFNLRSEFSTDISESTAERKKNVALSINQFNGLVVKPEEIISFNQIVGPRSQERGYQTAKIILDGEFTDGIGGGVCQTSTTLYNALLLSDIQITSYKRHTLKVSYVSPSFDAMVSSHTDLKFKNNSKNYIYFKTICTNDNATVQIYGEKLDYQIVRKSEINFTGETKPEKKIIDTDGNYSDKIKYKDESIVLTPSRPEIKSTGYLLYIKNGKIFKTKKLRSDTYKGIVGTIVYGRLERPKPLPLPDIIFPKGFLN